MSLVLPVIIIAIPKQKSDPRFTVRLQRRNVYQTSKKTVS